MSDLERFLKNRTDTGNSEPISDGDNEKEVLTKAILRARMMAQSKTNDDIKAWAGLIQCFMKRDE